MFVTENLKTLISTSMCTGEHRDEMLTQNRKARLIWCTQDMRCKYTGASGSTSKKWQNRTESECGGVQNWGKVCSNNTVRGAEKECQIREVWELWECGWMF